ncbi:MAG: multidrug effflux MFS transporter [Desulfobacter sp.]|nr:multidrug effflux MFS transporter [Desulfobacter sp.]WDP85613.1 MAG: multidrug effflux MFS transporter [Desulfobacter sp.]
MKTNKTIWLLALLSAFPPLSTDMYLPAIPLLQKTWDQPLSTINLTLVGFFISYCICLLFYGPLSDRFGRRPPLLAGIGIYIVASLLCGVSGNVGWLILFRVFQAAGGAAASAMALAISKDVYQGHERGKILAYIGVIMALAPMVAPVIGGWVMIWLSWEYLFFIQAMIGMVAWAGVYRMPETLEQVSAISMVQTAGIYLALLKNKRFIGFTLMMSLVVIPHFSFIGGSADIYITRMGVSEQVFSYFFAMNAAAIMAGSFTFTRMIEKVSSEALMTLSFVGIFIGGLGMVLPWMQGPWGLGLPMAVISFSFGLSRPPSNNLVLEQVDRHGGAASALMVFIYFILGAFSMWLISLDWTDKVFFIGGMGMVCGGSLTGLWLGFSKFAQKPSP